MTDVLCDRHVGNPWPPRCPVCEALTVEYNLLGIEPVEVSK